MKIKKLISVLLIMLSSFFVLPTFAADSGSLDRIIAVVNENVITASQLQQQINITQQQLQAEHVPVPPPAELRKKVLDHMIDVQLQLQMAKKMGLKVSDADLDKAIEDIAQRNGATVADLKQKLQQQGISYDQYRDQIRDQMTISHLQERVVGSSVSVSDQDIQDSLNIVKQHPIQQSTATPAMSDVAYNVQDLLIALPENASAQDVAKAQTQAETAITKLRANDFSVDPSIQSTDLNWRRLSDLPSVFAQAVKDKRAGEVVGPIRAPNGFHVLRVLGVHGNQTTDQQPVNLNQETHARHILIKSTPLQPDADIKTRLERIRNDIVHGEDFAVAAQQDSQDPGSASKGGDLGWTSPGMFDPVFENEMNKLKIGDISEPFKTQFGWHIVQVLGRRQMAAQTSLTNQARELAYQRKSQEAIDRWLKQARTQAYIKIND